MRLAITTLILVVLLAPAGYAADDAVAKAMKLYEKRHYAEAASMLRADLHKIEPGRQGAAQMTLGMIYLKNAELHLMLYRESLALDLHYLMKLASARGRFRSRFADLYMGESLLESGNMQTALSYLEKFAADETIDARHRAEARSAIGLCYALENNLAKADEAWAGLDKNDPEIKASLAYAFSRAGLRDREAPALVDESLADVKKAGRSPSLRHVRYVLGVYSAERLVDKGLDLVNRADLKAYSYRESLSRTKIIAFYDVSLLRGLSQLYLDAAVAALQKASEDGKLMGTANFYLGEAYSLSGRIDQSMKSYEVFIGSPSMPEQYREEATARQAANLYQKGRRAEALGKWDELSKKQPADPDVLAEILLGCGRLHVDCRKIAQKATASVDAGEGKRFSNLNIGLGRYYLGRKDYSRAASYLEAGRDKGNKNKIEANDPVMLVSLAEAYYRTKKFSEALEIYFEMSRQFPEVRQIQEALQGIYAMEHKSAGDVKIN